MLYCVIRCRAVLGIQFFWTHSVFMQLWSICCRVGPKKFQPLDIWTAWSRVSLSAIDVIRFFCSQCCVVAFQAYLSLLPSMHWLLWHCCYYFRSLLNWPIFLGMTSGKLGLPAVSKKNLWKLLMLDFFCRPGAFTIPPANSVKALKGHGGTQRVLEL